MMSFDSGDLKKPEFLALNPRGRVPVVVSLHATKALGIGEGGFVASTDHALIGAVARCCNFGFLGSRETRVPAFNAKMSEVHAAVGLAALDGWPRTRGEF